MRPRKGHHQLSDLVWATSRNEVYVMNDRKAISMFSLATRQLTPVYEGFQISTFAVNKKLLVVGGLYGQLAYKRLDDTGETSRIKMTEENDSIITSIEIYDR